MTKWCEGGEFDDVICEWSLGGGHPHARMISKPFVDPTNLLSTNELKIHWNIQIKCTPKSQIINFKSIYLDIMEHWIQFGTNK